MKIDVRFRGLEPSDALRDHAVRAIQFHLRRFGQEISWVLVRISDVNGPKGGLDKQCQVTVHGRRLSNVILDDLSGDAHSAIDMAVERVSRAVARDLQRVRGARAPFPMPRRAS
ncbi:MAG TPA: HPF/RaiA family ribosome-associated protein [Polyangiaceae bacterium]|nr:HPF/RaiA family ribosome-associated protein [Polyangiaceae bacterium]